MQRTFKYLWGYHFTWAIALGCYMTCTEMSFHYRSYLNYKENRKSNFYKKLYLLHFSKRKRSILKVWVFFPLVALLLSIFNPDKQLLPVSECMPLSQVFCTIPAWKHQRGMILPVLLTLVILSKGFCAVNTFYKCYKPLVWRLVTLENWILRNYF